MSNLNIKNIHGGTLDALGLALIRGDYPPGSKLPPEQKLCEMLGVSRTILREAVKSLVAKGLISTGPKIGTIVQPAERWNWFDRDVVDWQSRIGFPAQLLDDLQELRAVIEPQAVRLACSRATAQEIADLEAAYHGMAQAVADGDDTVYIAHDYAFHFGLLRASHNQMFLQMGRALQGLLEHIFKITEDALKAFHDCCRIEGIIPALESSHAVAYACKLAPTLSKDKVILINLSGRGDKDMHTVAQATGSEG